MTKIKWEWTIPNVLSLFRLALIPAIVATYLTDQPIWVPALLLALSGLTDLFDGAIARHFNQISEIGKLLDPIADKLTQVAVIVSLAIKIPPLRWLVGIVVLKELLQGIGGLLLLRTDVKVHAAEWFGKISTVLFYVVMVAIVVFPEMPQALLYTLIVLVALAMIAAFAGYCRTFCRLRSDAKKTHDIKEITQ
ncbi:MAG: CDP-alcohol phosphatidyltransferase family protein [Clostridia bacterium]|nr:CDP-alcohol phosphatidyltransferase family protein [Clostridia bacterium]